MKVGTRLQFNCPDKCPHDCAFVGSFNSQGQGSICMRCPVFNCTPADGFHLLEPNDFRDDWAQEWQDFFDTGKVPELQLTRKDNEK